MELSANPLFSRQAATHLLAVVLRCDTGGKDATTDLVTHTAM